MVHVEADNLLYGKMTDLLPAFRKHYKGLAATPLNSNKSFITSSVLWVASLAALEKFNNFLLSLGRDKKEWKKYLDWLRPFGCCKKGVSFPTYTPILSLCISSFSCLMINNSNSHSSSTCNNLFIQIFIRNNSLTKKVPCPILRLTNPHMNPQTNRCRWCRSRQKRQRHQTLRDQ